MTPISFVGSKPFAKRGHAGQERPHALLGLHEPGGEFLFDGARRPGWILWTHALGHDPNSEHGTLEYTKYADRGFGIVARLNNGYNPIGTIPLPLYYKQFSKRIGHHVRLSPGCRIWIIGNEINHVQELPFGQWISPADYAACFELCRAEIKRQPGHAEDWVIPAPMAPWFPPGAWGGYLDMYTAILERIECDAIALHAYGRTPAPSSVNEDHIARGGVYDGLQWEFRTYRDFMAATPASKKRLPILITESNQYGPWANLNTGFVQAAVAEIKPWKQILALILFRWPIAGNDQWAIEGKSELYKDIRAAAMAS